MKVYVIGVGYVGLVTAVCLAELGHEVLGVDINKEKVKLLEKGTCPIYEPGLSKLLLRNLKSKRLKFKHKIGKEINDYDMAVIAVSTPERNGDGKADLFYVGETSKDISRHVSKKEFVVIDKSTVPIGTTDQISKSLELYNNSGTKFHVGSNPETLREGSAVHDFMNPDRIIIGGDKKIHKILGELYKKIDCSKILTDAKSAEMIKLASNFMLALRISSANILSRICDVTGANIEEVMRGVGMDKRIGRQFLRAGLGYGGSCFPKDTKNIRFIAEHNRLDTSLFDSVVRINNDQKKWFCGKIESMATFSMKKMVVTLWGVAFKPETDDIREAPSIDIIKQLLKEGVRVRVYDPVASVERVFGDKIEYFDDMYKAAKDSEMLLIITEWDQFKKADLNEVKSLMSVPRIIDGRNIYNPQKIRKLGFEYSCMGRP